MLVAALLTQVPPTDGWIDVIGDKPLVPISRKTDRFPLSDQANQGRWVRYAPMSDEFRGNRLDPKKWHDHNPGWKGRQPAFFDPRNVKVSDGKLHLSMTVTEPTEELRKEGYHTFASAAVQSLDKAKYGYFEIAARPMRSHGSSAFWFYDITEDDWTEIDVFEIGGGAPGFERLDHMNVHFWKSPTAKEHWAIPGIWKAERDLADGYRVYGFEWDEKELRFYIDGVLVRRGPNTHWHQDLTLNFDSETMPDWFGIPKPEELPSVFSIEYVRAWKRKP